MDFLTHPYVIIFIVVAVVISNIMALKYTANMKITPKKDPFEHLKKPSNHTSDETTEKDESK